MEIAFHLPPKKVINLISERKLKKEVCTEERRQIEESRRIYEEVLENNPEIVHDPRN